MAYKRSYPEGSGNEFVGYITNTSPLKTGKDGTSKFFSATLQLANSETKRMICFDEEKFETVKALEKQETPAKIIKASLIPSLNKETMDIKITRNTTIDGMKTASFKKRRLDFEHANAAGPMTTLDGIDSTSGDISVKVKVCDVSGVTDEYMFNRPTKKQNVKIADKTALTTLSLFGTTLQQLDLSKCYIIENVQYRNFSGPFLTTTTRTHITECSDIGFVNQTEVQLPKSAATIKQIMLDSTHKCSACNKPVCKGERYTRCTSCGMKQLTCDLRLFLTIKVNVMIDGNFKKLIMFQNTLQQFLHDNNLPYDLNNSSDDIEEYFLGKTFLITIQNDILTTITPEKTYQSSRSLPSNMECPGGTEAWKEIEITNTGLEMHCISERDTCSFHNVTCPNTNAECVNTGPGMTSCLCLPGYHGYKCLRKGDFPVEIYIISLCGSTVVLCLLLWCTQRRNAKKEN